MLTYHSCQIHPVLLQVSKALRTVLKHGIQSVYSCKNPFNHSNTISCMHQSQLQQMTSTVDKNQIKKCLHSIFLPHMLAAPSNATEVMWQGFRFTKAKAFSMQSRTSTAAVDLTGQQPLNISVIVDCSMKRMRDCSHQCIHAPLQHILLHLPVCSSETAIWPHQKIPLFQL